MHMESIEDESQEDSDEDGSQEDIEEDIILFPSMPVQRNLFETPSTPTSTTNPTTSTPTTVKDRSPGPFVPYSVPYNLVLPLTLATTTNISTSTSSSTSTYSCESTQLSQLTLTHTNPFTMESLSSSLRGSGNDNGNFEYDANVVRSYIKVTKDHIHALEADQSIELVCIVVCNYYVIIVIMVVCSYNSCIVV